MPESPDESTLPIDPAPRRDLAMVWLILLWALFAIFSIRWIAVDWQPQGVDQSAHLMRSLEFRDAFAAWSPSMFKDCWLAEYGSIGQYTYPPLYHVVTGFFLCFFSRPALAATVANTALLLPLMLSVYQLGRRAFQERAAALAAAALTPMYLCMAQFQHEAFIEFSHTALAAWCAWRLMATERFERRGASIVFGIAMGLGLLTKQLIVVFLFAPVLYILLRNVRTWNRRMWMNVLLAGVVMLVIAMSWYGFHIGATLRTAKFNQEIAATENDPMPWTIAGSTFYLRMLSAVQIGLPLSVLAVVAAGVWLYRRIRFGAAVGEARDARAIILWWLAGSFLVLTFLERNKEFRYYMPFLPAVALLTCSLIAWTPARPPDATSRSRPIWWLPRALVLALIFACALPFYTLIAFGVSPIDRTIAFNTGKVRWALWQTDYYYGTGPQNEDWNIPLLLAHLHDDYHGKRPMRLALVPYELRFNPQSIKLESLARNIPIVITACGNLENPDTLRNYDYVFIMPLAKGIVFQSKNARQVNTFVQTHPDLFVQIQIYPMPNQMIGRLYRVRPNSSGPKTQVATTSATTSSTTTTAGPTAKTPAAPDSGAPTRVVRGFIETISCRQVTGWTYDPKEASKPLEVEIFADDQSLGRLSADVYRKDLQNSGGGDGKHGFTFPIPDDRLHDGKPHHITVRIADTNVSLKVYGNVSETITCPAK